MWAESRPIHFEMNKLIFTLGCQVTYVHIFTTIHQIYKKTGICLGAVSLSARRGGQGENKKNRKWT